MSAETAAQIADRLARLVEGLADCDEVSVLAGSLRTLLDDHRRLREGAGELEPVGVPQPHFEPHTYDYLEVLRQGWLSAREETRLAYRSYQQAPYRDTRESEERRRAWMDSMDALRAERRIYETVCRSRGVEPQDRGY